MLKIGYLSEAEFSGQEYFKVHADAPLNACRRSWCLRFRNQIPAATVFLLDVAGADVLFHAMPFSLRWSCRLEQWASANRISFIKRYGPAILDSMLRRLPGGNQWVSTRVARIKHPQSGAAGVRIWRYADSGQTRALLSALPDEPHVYCVPVPLWVEWQLQQWRASENKFGPSRQTSESAFESAGARACEPAPQPGAIPEAVSNNADSEESASHARHRQNTELLIYSVGNAGSHHTLLVNSQLVLSRFLAHQNLVQALRSDAVNATLRHIHLHFPQDCFPTVITIDRHQRLQGLWVAAESSSTGRAELELDVEQLILPEGCVAPVVESLFDSAHAWALPQTRAQWYPLALRASQPAPAASLLLSKRNRDLRWLSLMLTSAQRLRLVSTLPVLGVLSCVLLLLLVRDSQERRRYQQALSEVRQQHQRQMQELDKLPIPAERLHALMALRSRSTVGLVRDLPDMLQVVADVFASQHHFFIHRIHWREALVQTAATPEVDLDSSSGIESGFDAAPELPVSTADHESATLPLAAFVVTLDGKYIGTETSWQQALLQLDAIEAHLARHPAMQSVRLTRLPFGLDASASAVVMHSSRQSVAAESATKAAARESAGVTVAMNVDGSHQRVVLDSEDRAGLDADVEHRSPGPMRVEMQSDADQFVAQAFQMRFEWRVETAL